MFYEKKVYQNMAVKAVDMKNGEVEIINKSFFTNLAEYTTVWQLLEDGEIVSSGELSLNIEPQSSKTISVPYPNELEPTSEYFLNILVLEKKGKFSIPKGHEVAFEQLLVRKAKQALKARQVQLAKLVRKESKVRKVNKGWLAPSARLVR